MKLLAHLLTAALIGTAATTAQAWGEREQGALAGIAGVLLFNQLTRPQPPAPQYYVPPVVVQPPVYVYPQQPYYVYRHHCWAEPYFDQYGRVAGYVHRCR